MQAQIDKNIIECCSNIPLYPSITSPNLVNYSYSMPYAAQERKKKRLIVYDLDKLIFPNDPIRDYIEAEIAKIEEKYRARLERLEAFKFKKTLDKYFSL